MEPTNEQGDRDPTGVAVTDAGDGPAVPQQRLGDIVDGSGGNGSAADAGPGSSDGERNGAVATAGPEDRSDPRWMRRTALVAAAIVLVGALGGLVGSFLWPAQYAGRATVLYVISQEQPTGFLREDRNLTTQSLLATSNAVLAPVAVRYGLTTQDLAEKTTATVADGSELITIEVRDHSPELATRMAADVTDSYLGASVAAQPMAAQKKYLQDQLTALTATTDRLRSSASAADVAQLAASSQRESDLRGQLDTIVLAEVGRPQAQLVVPAFAVPGRVSPSVGLAVAGGALVGVVVAAVVAGLRWRSAGAG